MSMICMPKGSPFDQHPIVKLQNFPDANDNSILVMWFCYSVAQINYATSYGRY